MNRTWSSNAAGACVAAGMLALCGAVASAGEITWFTIQTWTGDTKARWAHELAEFTAQTGIKVNVIHNTDKSYGGKALTMIAAGESPDVMLLRGQREFPEFGSLDLMTDLSGYLKASSLPLTDYAPPMLDGLKWAGRQIAVPFDATFYLGMVKLNELAQAGLTPPGLDWTWADLQAMAKKLTQKGADGKVSRYGAFIPDWAYEEMVLSAGIPALKEDHTWNWNQPDVIEMLNFWRDLFTTDPVADPNGDFFGGNVAMAVDGTWDIPFQKPKFDWDVDTMPRWRDFKHGSELIVEGLGIPKAAKNPDDAFRFIEWYNSRARADEELKAGVINTSLVPDRRILLQNLAELGQVAPHLADVYTWTFTNGFQLPRPSWYIGDDNYWNISYLDDALSSQSSIANAMQQMEQKVNALTASGAGWRDGS
ncbi:MAG TPA: extracellular solute-binding protein [Limnochordia bacterium]|nr:extracellular solute-binding protein [Limnochordia bacterium]